MVSGFRGRIPKRDAHIYIYTSENSVLIMCLALRGSAIMQFHTENEILMCTYNYVAIPT